MSLNSSLKLGQLMPIFWIIGIIWIICAGLLMCIVNYSLNNFNVVKKRCLRSFPCVFVVNMSLGLCVSGISSLKRSKPHLIHFNLSIWFLFKIWMFYPGCLSFTNSRFALWFSCQDSATASPH